MSTNETELSIDTEFADRIQDRVDSLDVDTDDLAWFLVGGAVRDHLLDREPEDFDFVVVDETARSMERRGFDPIEASSFPVFMDGNGDEWALARTEESDGDGYKGFQVDTEDVSLCEDLKRRDLTINSMAMGPMESIADEGKLLLTGSGEMYFVLDDNGVTRTASVITDEKSGDLGIVDAFGGLRDIEQGVLRRTSGAFAEDPLRVIRLARYAARFPEFEVDEETGHTCAQIVDELNRMSRERIGEEIVKAMKQAEEPDVFWRVLSRCNALAVLWPDLDRARIVPAGPEKFHAEGDVFTHTMLALDRMHEICEERNISGHNRVRRFLAIVAHDIGKVSIADRAGGLHSDEPPRKFGGHNRIGAELIEDVGRRLGLERSLICVMRDACALHMDACDIPDWGPERIIEFVDQHTAPDEADKPYFITADEMIDVLQADQEGRLDRPIEYNVAVDESGFCLEVTDEDQFEEDGLYSLREPEVPTFDHDPFERVIGAARSAIETVDGFEAMREGLCDEHEGIVDDDMISDHLETCPECRSPGPWIGELIDERRAEIVEEVIL